MTAFPISSLTLLLVFTVRSESQMNGANKFDHRSQSYKLDPGRALFMLKPQTMANSISGARWTVLGRPSALAKRNVGLSSADPTWAVEAVRDRRGIDAFGSGGGPAKWEDTQTIDGIPRPRLALRQATNNINKQAQKFHFSLGLGLFQLLEKLCNIWNFETCEN